MSHTANSTLTIQVFRDVNPRWLIQLPMFWKSIRSSSKPKSGLVLLLQNVN